MDAAGLILTVVGLVKPVCLTIHEALSDYRAFGKDAESLRLRFAVQQTRLESFQRVLFDDNKFAPAMPGRLIDHLPKKFCDDILALLNQLYTILIEYTAVRSQYQIQDRDGGLSAAEIAGMSTEERMKALALDGKKADAKQQKATGWARKLLWVTYQKNSTEKLVTEFETWAERTRQLLEAAWWPLSFFETVERMQRLEEDGDARSVGLLRGIEVRKVLAAPSVVQAVEVTARSFRVTSQLGNFELGTIQGTSETRLVEYKSSARGGTSSASDAVIRQRVVQLAALLDKAPSSDPDLRVLQCTSYFEDAIKARFGLVYTLPSSPSGGPPKLVTLASILDAKHPGGRPTLSARIRLAHRIALCLQRLHAFSWVHKSLRPDNILVFPSPREAAAPTSSGSLVATGQHGSADSLEEPRIAGFEYARKDSDFYSDRFGELEIKRNIYRHPTRWGEPTERFQKVHDVYALGVMLLELGLWERADQLDRGALVTREMANAPEAVKKRLLKHAEMRLGFYAGERYRDVVVGCLTGTWRDTPITEALLQVVAELKAIAREV